MTKTILERYNVRVANSAPKEKHCMFPGCTTVFSARGKKKYCDEHTKAKYRAELYKKEHGETAVYDQYGNNLPQEKINRTYTPVVIYATKHEFRCACCDKPYTVTLVPAKRENDKIYPNYCEEHRNEYRRNRFYDLNPDKSYIEPDGHALFKRKPSKQFDNGSDSDIEFGDGGFDHDLIREFGECTTDDGDCGDSEFSSEGWDFDGSDIYGDGISDLDDGF